MLNRPTGNDTAEQQAVEQAEIAALEKDIQENEKALEATQAAKAIVEQVANEEAVKEEVAQEGAKEEAVKEVAKEEAAKEVAKEEVAKLEAEKNAAATTSSVESAKSEEKAELSPLQKKLNELAARAKNRTGLNVTRSIMGFGAETSVRIPNSKLESELQENQLVKEVKDRIELTLAQKDGMRSGEQLRVPGSDLDKAQSEKLRNGYTSDTTGVILSTIIKKKNELNATIEYKKDNRLKKGHKYLNTVEATLLAQTKENWKNDKEKNRLPWFPQKPQANATAFLASSLYKKSVEQDRSAKMLRNPQPAPQAETENTPAPTLPSPRR